MDLFVAVRNYVSKMLTIAGSGMKVLLLDDDTLKITSLVYAMSEIMKQEVYLVERISLPREPLEHLRCVCFLRPTNRNVELLSRELSKPNYSSYYVFFSHSLTKQLLKQLAEADEHELIVEIHEFYGDFLPLSPFLFELNIPHCLEGSQSAQQLSISRCTEGITAVLLALKQLPVIRYANSSEAARQLAESVRSFISRETVLFDFDRKPESSSLLLILDRREDPVTPLLIQWTYEAMIHDLIGIQHNRIDLSRAPNIRPELKEVILSRDFDEFFRQNQYANFGEIGQAIKKLVEGFQAASRSVDVKNFETISDLKRFLEHYPAFRKTSGTVETHVTIVSELSRLVKERALLEISEAQQELVCHDNQSSSLNQIRALLNDPRVSLVDAIKLTLLYALRYESNTRELNGLIQLLLTRGATNEDVQLIRRLLQFSGPRKGSDGHLFNVMKNVTSVTQSINGQSASSAVASITKRLVKGLKGVDNVYTQHEPLLLEIINDVLKGKLRETAFPYLPSVGPWTGTPNLQRPRKIIIFILGGATYEESRTVYKLNTTTPDVDILLGGSCMHNSCSFLEEVRFATDAVKTDVENVRTYQREKTQRNVDKPHVRYGLLN